VELRGHGISNQLKWKSKVINRGNGKVKSLWNSIDGEKENHSPNG
jgi:hypothetical protein